MLWHSVLLCLVHLLVSVTCHGSDKSMECNFILGILFSVRVIYIIEFWFNPTLEPSGIPIDSKPIGKLQIKYNFVRFNKDQEPISLRVSAFKRLDFSCLTNWKEFDLNDNLLVIMNQTKFHFVHTQKEIIQYSFQNWVIYFINKIISHKIII